MPKSNSRRLRKEKRAKERAEEKRKAQDQNQKKQKSRPNPESQSPDLPSVAEDTKSPRYQWVSLRDLLWSWQTIVALVLFILPAGQNFMTSSHPILADICYVTGCSIFLVKFLSWEGAKHMSVRIVGGFVVMTALVGATALNHYMNRVGDSLSDPAYIVSIARAFVSSEYGQSHGFWLIQDLPTGRIASPVEAEIDISITNVSSLPKRITGLGVEIENDDGQWTLLQRMNPRFGQLAFVPADPTFARLAAVTRSLDAQLADRDIGAGETIAGVALFEFTKDPGSLPQRSRYRVTVTDASGRTQTEIVSDKPPIPPGSSMVQPTMGIDQVPDSMFDFSVLRQARFGQIANETLQK